MSESSISVDDQLDHRLRKGDERALAELFSRHRDRLWRTANFRLPRQLQGRIDPEDVLQDAYLAASQRLIHYRKITTSPFIWLRMIVSQTLVDLHRRHLGTMMRDAGQEVSIDCGAYPDATSMSVAIQLVGNLTSPSQAATRGEMMTMVEEAIGSMDAMDREVLALRHYEELTNKEVAETLDITQKTASIRYIRATRRLREVIASHPGLLEGYKDG